MKHWDFILLDVVCAELSLIVAYWLRFGFSSFLYADENFVPIALWTVGFSALIAVALNTMHNVLKRSLAAEIRQTLTQCGLVFAGLIVLLYSLKTAERISRIVLYLMLGLYIVLSFTARMLWKRVLMKRPFTERRRLMLLITDTESAAAVLEQFKAHPAENIYVPALVLVDRDAKGETFCGLPVAENLTGAANYICREWIDEVCVSVSDPRRIPYELLQQCEQMGVTTHERLLSIEKREGKQIVERLAGMQMLTSSIKIASPFQLLIKRVIDILGGAVLSLIALILMAVLGPILKRKSPGPILYKQERIGQNGRKFKMYKIRSMHTDADEQKAALLKDNKIESGLMFKMDFDPRIIGNEILPDGTKKTGIGEFIRRTSLDEFPQGFNVLLGQMSLVGTRPPTVDEWEQYELHHRARLSAKPGITGMWQVSGRSEITDFEEITRLDTQYIANWSIGLDMKILWKTVGVVLKRKGAL